MSTYNGIAVLDGWEPNWREPIRQGNAYDLKPEQVGYGEESLAPTEAEVTRTHEVSFSLTGDEWKHFMHFFNLRRGAAGAFWLPGCERLMQVETGVSATSFEVRAADWLDWWQAHPGSAHVWLVDPDEVPYAAEIEGIETISEEVERVTLTETTAQTVTPDWEVRSLYLVRLADDRMEMEFPSPDHVEVRMRVVELPQELETVETATRPVWLYEFAITPPTGSVRWRFTSHQEAVEYDGDEYAPTAIEHGEIRTATRSDGESVELISWWAEGNPLLAFFPFPLACPMDVTIIKTSLDNLAVGSTVFTGRIGKVSAQGKRLTATVRSRIDVLGRVFPRFAIQPMCNYRLGSGPCGVDLDDHKVTGVLNENPVDGNVRRVKVNACVAESGRYAQGWLVTGSGATIEIRSILASNEDKELTLNAPLYHAQEGDAVTVYEGCDGRKETCTERFANYERFGGHPFVPLQNLVLRAVELESGEGGKK